MKYLLFLLLLAAGCHHSANEDSLALIQIQDRNGLTETISNPDRLNSYKTVDFLSTQPYKKVLRLYKNEGKNRSTITTYHPNGAIFQYLEAQEMRANGAYREWFSNGQLKLEANVIGGTADLCQGSQEDWVFDSLSQVWDENGNLLATIPYSKGVLEGISTYYYPSGQVERTLPFFKGRLQGDSYEYWPEGSLKAQTHYKTGVKNGESSGFFENGRIAWKEHLLDGRLLSGSYYSPFGDFVSEVMNGGGFKALFENDAMTLIEHRVGIPDGLVQKFTSAGELYRSYYIKNGMKEGEEVEYFRSTQINSQDETPKPKMSLYWHENMIHGVVKTWYDNGQLQSQKEYCRNKRMGPLLGWYRDGHLMIYEEYDEDRLITGQYYKFQRKEPISSVTNGNGLATLYDEYGGFIRKITYQKGKAVDPEE